MANLADIRELVAAAGAGPVGGRAYAYMPDQITVGPEGVLVIVIDPGDTVIERLTFDRTMQYRLRARVIVGGASAEARQRTLDERVSPRGEKSIWAALESDGVIPGIDYIQVERVSGYGEYQEGDLRYLAAELECVVVESA